MLKVKEIMTTKVISVTPENTFGQTKALMTEHHIRHIPVLDEAKKLMGIVTQRDVLRAQSSCLQGEESSAMKEDSASILAVMSDHLKSVHPQDSLRSAGILMQSHKIGCLPVLEDEQLVGIITDSDFVGVAINLIEEQDYHEEQGTMDDDF